MRVSLDDFPSYILTSSVLDGARGEWMREVASHAWR